MKLDQYIHSIRVGCDNCNGPYLTKDRDLDEHLNKKAHVFTLVGINMMKTGESQKSSGCLMTSTRSKRTRDTDKPVDATTKKNNHHQRIIWILSQYLIGLCKPLKKRHDTTDTNVRNHQASINNIETQLGQLTTFANKRLPPKNPDPKAQPHVMAIYTEKRSSF